MPIINQSVMVNNWVYSLTTIGNNGNKKDILIVKRATINALRVIDN